MTKTYSVSEALDLLPLLTGLLVKLGSGVPELLEHRSVWFNAQIGSVPTTPTSPALDTIEPTDDYFLDLAALAAKSEKLLIKLAENHRRSPRLRADGAITPPRVESRREPVPAAINGE